MRIVTRGDLDGLAGSVIVALNEQIDEITLIHPQDITEGKVEITSDDILINLPYHPSCAKWFDHHLHTATYAEPPTGFDGAYGQSPSAAHLVYDYYGGADAMPRLEEMVRQTDRLDSADLRPGDVLVPRDFIKLGFTLDSRTGLGAFESYFNTLHTLLVDGADIAEVLEHPEVRRRCDLIAANDRAYREVLREHSEVDGNVVITDLRALDTPPIGNRFMIYAIFPMANVSLRLHWGPQRSFVVAALGHSIFNRTCQTDVGQLAARHGGGGHRGASSIPLEPGGADATIAGIIAELKENG
jgi:hypothetical protein